MICQSCKKDVYIVALDKFYYEHGLKEFEKTPLCQACRNIRDNTLIIDKSDYSKLLQTHIEAIESNLQSIKKAIENIGR